MGCDIHFYVEKKIKGTWVSQDTFVQETSGEGEDKETYWAQKNDFYGGRNYDTFAILADVRNGRGFAGIKTGEGFNPISMPRGLPNDVSKETKRASDGMGGDGHSHSWLTLRELLDYDWTQETGKQGWVDLSTWADWIRWDRADGLGPRSHCGDVSGGPVKKVSAEVMDQLAADLDKLRDREDREAFLKKHGSTYAMATWKTPYYRSAQYLLGTTIPRLLKLAGGVNGADDVRIVFFFDN